MEIPSSLPQSPAGIVSNPDVVDSRHLVAIDRLCIGDEQSWV